MRSMETGDDGIMLGLRREMSLVTDDDDARPGSRRVDVSAVL
jgi:hypothetical protein